MRICFKCLRRNRNQQVRMRNAVVRIMIEDVIGAVGMGTHMFRKCVFFKVLFHHHSLHACTRTEIE